MTHLAQLLPYDPDSKRNGALRSSLKEYQTLVQATRKAVDVVQNRHYEQLDSLVGENACQIRAIWLCLMLSNQPQNHQFLQSKLIEVVNQLENLLDQQTLEGLMKSSQSFKSIIEEKKLNIPLSSMDLILIVSFLLYEMKIVKPQGEQMSTIFRVSIAASKNLNRYGDVSNSFGLNLINKLRKMLATASVQFVREQALIIQDPLLIRMTSEAFTVTHNTMPCAPMFWTCKVVFTLAQNEGIPIILHTKFLTPHGKAYTQIDEHTLLYQVDSNGIYQLTPPTDLDRPACVVQGIACIDQTTWSKSDWMARMSSTSVIDIILAGAADHRQYPDPALDVRFEHTEDSDYALYKLRALAEGFAADNPSTFFIQHVYAALASRMFNLSAASQDIEPEMSMCKQGFVGASL